MKSVIKILLLLLPVFANAQFDQNWGYVNGRQADSLIKTLAIEKNDTLLMAANRSLGFYYQETKLDSALLFHQEQVQLAKKLDLKMWLADAYSQVGYLFLFMGNATQAYDNFMEAKTIAENEKNESSSWHPWVFSNAQSQHEARLAILAMNYNGMGNLFYDLDEPAKGMEAYKEFLHFGEQTRNGKILSTAYGNIGGHLSGDSIIQYSKKAIQFAQESGYKKNIGSSLLNIAYGFANKGAVDSAIQYAYASLSANLEQNNMRLLANSYGTMAMIHIFERNLDSSLFYAKRTLATAESVQVPEIFLSAYTSLARVYGLQNNKDSGYKYGQLAYNLNDSLKNVRIKQLTDFQKSAFNEQLRLKKLNDDKTANQNKLKLYGAIASLAAVFLVAVLLYRNNHQKQKANNVLETTLSELQSTQSQLIQSEKMASLGELTAGIAHEIQNPLNFVNNFSEVNKELADELQQEIDKGNYSDAKALAKDIKDNEEKINHHGKRADAIVKGMLQHSQKSAGEKTLTDINALADEYLRLSYHGLRAKDKSFNVTMKTDFDESIGKINIIPQDIGRVLLNLYNNAFYAVNEKSKSEKEKYQPVILVSTKKMGDRVEIKVADNGNGIPQKVIDKIFQPFFTTKPTGQGTGLGLSLSYDIVKAHGGEIKVASKDSGSTEFVIQLPVTN